MAKETPATDVEETAAAIAQDLDEEMPQPESDHADYLLDDDEATQDEAAGDMNEELPSADEPDEESDKPTGPSPELVKLTEEALPTLGADFFKLDPQAQQHVLLRALAQSRNAQSATSDAEASGDEAGAFPERPVALESWDAGELSKSLSNVFDEDEAGQVAQVLQQRDEAVRAGYNRMVQFVEGLGRAFLELQDEITGPRQLDAAAAKVPGVTDADKARAQQYLRDGTTPDPVAAMKLAYLDRVGFTKSAGDTTRRSKGLAASRASGERVDARRSIAKGTPTNQQQWADAMDDYLREQRR